MTSELFLHFYFPFSSQCSTVWLLTSPSAEIAFSVGYGQLLTTKLPSDELSFYLVFTLLTIFLKQPLSLDFVASFVLFSVLSILPGLLNVLQRFVFGYLLAQYTLPEVNFILNLCLNGSKVYIFRLTLNFRPKFPAASWKCL